MKPRIDVTQHINSGLGRAMLALSAASEAAAWRSRCASW